VIRTSAEGKQITLYVDVEKIFKGSEPDPELEEGDLVTVPETFF
jgi:hypothetical protein